MAKNPIFPLFFNDFDRSTRDWTDEEVGCYLRLLLHQWDKFGLPLGFDRLSRIANSVEKNWSLIGTKFREVNGTLINERLEEIRDERLKKNKIAKENGDKGGRPKIKNKPNAKPKQEPKSKPDENLTDNLSYSYSSINSIPIGGGFVFDDNTDLPPNILEAAELNQFTHKKNKNTDFVKDQWRVFLTERMNDPPQKKLEYRQLSDLTSYFLNFVRTKFPNPNGSHQQSPSGNGSGEKLGTSAARIKTAKDW